jgi:HPt (histidine-containing phosphotransfer) domain-containing protein
LQWDFEYVEGDVETLQVMTEGFFEDVEEDLEQLRQGLKAKELEKAKIHAHSLKGASASIAGKQAREVAFIIEQAAINNDFDSCVRNFPNLRDKLDKLGQAIKSVNWDDLPDKITKI